jgi:hypothetical protein
MPNILTYNLLQKRRNKGSKVKRDTKDFDAIRGAIKFDKGTNPIGKLDKA